MSLEKLSPLNGSGGRSLDLHGCFHAGLAGSSQQAVDVWLSNISQLGKLPGGDTRLFELASEVRHRSKGNTPALTVQAPKSYSFEVITDDNSVMSRYIQQPALKVAVKAYQARTGKTQQEVAEALGTTLGTLRQWLNNKERRPELESLQKISALTRVSVMQFIDDPGADYAGQDLSQESEDTRFLASMIIRGVMKKDLSDEQKGYILQDISRAVDRVASMPPGPAAPGRADHPGAKPDVQPGPSTGGPGRTPRPRK